MMTQGEFMDLTKLQTEGLTVKEIADELGHQPATVSKTAQYFSASVDKPTVVQ